jgi:hypothetical protein
MELYLPSHSTPSWCGAQLKTKHRGNFTFYLYLPPLFSYRGRGNDKDPPPVRFVGNPAALRTPNSCTCAFNWAPRHEWVLRSGGIAPRILDLGTRWRSVVSFTPQPLYPQRKSPSYLLDKRLGGSQSRSGRAGEEKHSHPLPGLEPPIIQPVV